MNQCKGYVRITDLGIARKVRLDNASDTSGTPGYMGTSLWNDVSSGGDVPLEPRDRRRLFRFGSDSIRVHARSTTIQWPIS
jgi:hypothetical protein